jgi:hypothetical protein
MTTLRLLNEANCVGRNPPIMNGNFLLLILSVCFLPIYRTLLSKTNLLDCPMKKVPEGRSNIVALIPPFLKWKRCWVCRTTAASKVHVCIRKSTRQCVLSLCQQNIALCTAFTTRRAKANQMQGIFLPGCLNAYTKSVTQEAA